MNKIVLRGLTLCVLAGILIICWEGVGGRSRAQDAPPTPGSQPHTESVIDEGSLDPDGEDLTPNSIVQAIDPEKNVRRDLPGEPWHWDDPKPEGCSDLGEEKTAFECRAAKGSNELFWYKVTYQDYTCKPDFIPERVAVFEKTGSHCSKLNYAETRQAVTLRYRKQLDDTKQVAA